MSANRAARRREEKSQRKGTTFTEPGKATQPQIQLQNPVSEHFRAFIMGNAQHCDHVVEENSAKGQTLVLCGAGPSLAEHAAEYCPQADQIWGCNSALTWLHDNGYNPTHGLAVDQTAEMVNEWYSAPDVEYLVSSSCHPHLIEYLLEKGRRLRFFHNFVGIKERPVVTPDDNGVMQVMQYEYWMYANLYLPTLCAGSGLNAVTRAIDVAKYMGFGRIIVLGADCALRVKSKPPEGALMGSPEYQRWLEEDTVMHADGGSAIASNASPLTLGATIDPGTEDDEIRPGHGKYWQTKIDLVISALWLVRMQAAGQVELIGDTLPNALKNKNKDFLSRLPQLTDTEGNAIDIRIE